jgi:exonuclease SbcC
MWKYADTSMLIQSLRLKNIRSYTSEEITFSGGSTLLSGDIGSGKSTILLAIEFALFGMTKPNVTGETLLRKGESSGSVQLQLSIDNKEIVIERHLRKGKNGIQQQAGFIAINGKRKDLTPSELKSEVIRLLGYPETLATKSKNLVYRYTMYCPQEAMKEILEDSPTDRADTLKKIFNTDKYKRIRDHVVIFLRELKRKQTILETRTERLGELQDELQQLNSEKETLTKQVQERKAEAETIASRITAAREVLRRLEDDQNRHIQVKNQLAQVTALLTEKERQGQSLKRRKEELMKKRKSFHESATKEELEQELHSLDERITEYLSQKSSLEENIVHIQKRITELQKETAQHESIKKRLHEHLQRIRQLKDVVAEKVAVEERKKQLEKQVKTLALEIHTHALTEQEAQKRQDQISQLQECPLCLQEVPAHHRKRIYEQEEKKRDAARREKEQFTKELEQTRRTIEELERTLERITASEHQLTTCEAEVRNLNENVAQHEQKKRQLTELIKEHNRLMNQQQELHRINLENLQKKRQDLQKAIHSIIQQQEIDRYIQEVDATIHQLTNDHARLRQQQQQLQQELSAHPDKAKEMKAQKDIIDRLLTQEKDITNELVRVTTSKENVEKRLTAVERELSELKEISAKIIKMKTLHHWLNAHFIPLTVTIEKHVMTKIHRLFNTIFQEWFSMLIEDEGIYAYLDDSFTPVIEQQGHQILFQNLSGGERTSASLAYRLALNKVINDVIHGIKTNDVLILDEPTDGFSSEQLDKVRDVLEKLHIQQVIIVSHESKIESFVDDVIRVYKREQVSQVMS